MSNLVKPPFNWHIKDEGQLVFLAGPVMGAENWQDKAIELLHKEKPELIIANPRYETYPSKEELMAKLGSDDEHTIQINWETAHLRTASKTGGIMFWLAKEDKHFCERAYGQTTRFELAEWFTHYKYRKLHAPDRKLKLVIGIDPDFPGANYIISRVFDDCPEFVMATTLEETCALMLGALNEE